MPVVGRAPMGRWWQQRPHLWWYEPVAITAILITAALSIWLLT